MDFVVRFCGSRSLHSRCRRFNPSFVSVSGSPARHAAEKRVVAAAQREFRDCGVRILSACWGGFNLDGSINRCGFGYDPSGRNDYVTSFATRHGSAVGS